MLRSERGEGERPRKTKGSQIFIATLLFATPICMAESAFASTSAFLKPSVASSIGEYQFQGLAGQQKANQESIRYTGLLNQGGKQSPFRLLTSSDIDTLKSTLSQYKSQLTTLKSSSPKDPDNTAVYEKALNNVETKISDLEELISKVQADYAKQQDAQEILRRSINQYNLALANKESASQEASTKATTYQQALAILQEAQQSYDASLTRLNEATVNKDLAQEAYNLADASLTNQIAVTNEALNTLNNARFLTAEQTQQLEIVQQELDQAQQELDTASTNKAEAQSNYDRVKSVSDLAKSNYDQAHQSTTDYIATYNSLIDDYNIVYQEYLDAQDTVNITRTNLQEATNQLNQAQWNYDNLLIPTEGGEATVQGLTVKVYNQINSSNPQRSDTAYNLCKTTTLTNIQANWGGGDILGCGGDRVLIHYTGYFTPSENITYLMNQADDGFYLTLDGATIINDWRLKGCGGGWYPVNLQAGRTYALDAWFYEWGGGACSTLYYQSNNNWGVTPASWYSQNQPAQLTNNPALLPELHNARVYYDATVLANQQAEEDWQIAQANQQSAAQGTTDAYYHLIGLAETENSIYSNLQIAQADTVEAESNLNRIINVYDLALSNKSQKQTAYETAQADLFSSQQKLKANEITYQEATTQQETLRTAKGVAENNLTNAINVEASAGLDKTNKSVILTQSQSEEATASQNLTKAEANLQTSEEAESVALGIKLQREEALSSSQQTLDTSFQSATNASNISLTDVEEILNTPAPKPEPEPEGSAEIPAVIENLMDVDLEAVDPTELTKAQAEQLVEAALVAFETAEEGSAEYEQALDALALAAQQDDIVVDEALAAIPGVGQAAQAAVAVLNAIGNLGADISPKKRKEAQNLVVTTLVVGQIAQAAALATASSSSSSNRTFRRK